MVDDNDEDGQYWRFYSIWLIFRYIHTLTFLYTPSSLNDEGISMTDMEQLNDTHDDDEEEAMGKQDEARGSANIWNLNFEPMCVCVQVEAVGRHLPVLQSCHVRCVCTF